MVRQSELYDITVVGAGPVGLYATYYAGLRECRTKLIETYPQVGGRLISMYPEKVIFDVAGHRSIVAAELVRVLEAQAMQYHPTVVLNERVVSLRILGERVIELGTPAGNHYTQTVVIAAGCGAFVPRKLTSPA
jgi:thioredoxin reductase (NADPH)